MTARSMTWPSSSIRQQKITRFYFESRYPVGYEVEYSQAEIRQALEIAKDLAEAIARSGI